MTKITNDQNRTPSAPALGGMNLIIVGLLSTVLSILLLSIYDHYRYRPIMTVDVEQIMQNKMQAEQKKIMDSPAGSFDKERMIKLSQQWASQLADEVARLSRDYNAIVLVRPAVVEGGIDMTAQVAQVMSVLK
jgi:hypothetical protein